MPDDQNHRIGLLPRKERLRPLAICEPIDLVFVDVLCEPGERARCVYCIVGDWHDSTTQEKHAMRMLESPR